MKQHIEATVDRNVYDHVIVHPRRNDVDKLRVNDIAMNMESCVITLIKSDDGRTQKLLCLDSHMLLRNTTQKLMILIAATRQSARSIASPT